MNDNWEDVWKFYTKRFIVILSVTPEDDDPKDHFEFTDDVGFANEGGWHWFQARMQVVFRDADNPKRWAVPREWVLGRDYLGGCSYHSLEDFMAPGGYFRDMVREAVREARHTLRQLAALENTLR